VKWAEEKFKEYALVKGFTDKTWRAMGIRNTLGQMEMTESQFKTWKELGERVDARKGTTQDGESKPQITINIGALEQAEKRMAVDVQATEVSVGSNEPG
jgi:stress response protein YsnF